MNRITRMLTITGLGLFAGLTIGTGPAMAATNTSQSAVKPSAAAAPGDHVEGYYDTRDECRMAGRIGERFGRWDDWHCYPARGGWHEGDWVLVVNNDDHGGPFDHGHHGGPFDHGHHGGLPFHHGHHFPFHHKTGMKPTKHTNPGMPSTKPDNYR